MAISAQAGNRSMGSWRMTMLALLFASGSASACTTAAWAGGSPGGGTTAVNSYQLGGPRVWSGACALRVLAEAQGYLVDTSPVLDGSQPYHLRFFLHSALSAGAPVVLHADTADTPGAGMVFEIAFDAAEERLIARTPEGEQLGVAGSAPNGEWLEVIASYTASTLEVPGTFVVAVKSVTQGVHTLAAVEASQDLVQSVSIGTFVAAGSGTLHFDSFQSERGPDPIPFDAGAGCRGDSNGDGMISVLDLVIARNERHFITVATGTPDCTGDGNISIRDAVCIRRSINDARGCVPGSTRPSNQPVFLDGLE